MQSLMPKRKGMGIIGILQLQTITRSSAHFHILILLNFERAENVKYNTNALYAKIYAWQ